MNIRSKPHMLLPLLALGMTLALAGSATAQNRSYPRESGTSATLRVNFGSVLHWGSISGTRVDELPAAERPGYDMFRYGGHYYAYNNNRWYSSPNERGDFTYINDSDVPGEFSNIPREHWHSYPMAWQNRGQQSPGGLSATLRVNLGIAPHWSSIRGTQVDELPAGERPNYDMFRFGGAYYVHDNDRWFMSRQQSGDYAAMDDRDVPGEFSTIPREHWQHYPTTWNDPNGRNLDRRPMTMMVNVGWGARWSTIRGTRVMSIRGAQRPDFDLFRVGGSYYAYDGGRWYTSNRSRGQFTWINNRAVPFEMTRVPRYAWREYPSRWLDVNGNVRADLVSRDRYNRFND